MKKKELCQNCGKREATENWIGEGGALAFAHGWYKRWCKRCCLEMQIIYAELHKNDLEKLKKELENET
jgi:hypothetical protein